jgi:hypothetical protein
MNYRRELVGTFLEGGPFPLSRGKIWAGVGAVKVAKMDVARSTGSPTVVGHQVLEISWRNIEFLLFCYFAQRIDMYRYPSFPSNPLIGG